MLRHSYEFEAIGTHWEVVTDSELPEGIRTKISQRIELFDRTYSRFHPDSLIAQIAEKPGTYQFSDDVLPLISLYRELYDITNGRFTPLVGELLERAGYDAAYSFATSPQRTVPHWDDVMSWQGTQLMTATPVTLDFGAAGKGYLVDIISEILQQSGVTDFVIDASGDVYVSGSFNETIGLEHPVDASRVIGEVTVQNQSLCASATNRRAWSKNMHHIFDPATLAPVSSIASTWVITDTTLLADALATALFFCEPSKLHSQFEFQYVRMHCDGSVQYSSDIETALYA